MKCIYFTYILFIQYHTLPERTILAKCRWIQRLCILNPSPIQIWPSCCFFVPNAVRVRFQNRLKSRGGCATKMLRTEIIELFNASYKSTHSLCIDRKLRSFWVEWRSYQNVYPEQFNPPTSQLAVHFAVHRFAIGNSGRTCKLSGRTCDCSVNVFKSRNRGLNAREQWRTPHKN